MRRRIALLLAAMLTIGVMTATPAAANGNHDDHGRGDHRDGTYLALGDSVAAGTQQPLPFTDNGYTNALFKKLKRTYGFDKFVNLACPGDDTAEMLNGDGGADGSLCYGTAPVLPPGGTSQLDAAVAYLTSPAGADVELITITVGANDILACSPTFDEACVGPALFNAGNNLATILGTLQAVTDAPIVGMNYYQPNLAFWLVTAPAGQDAFMASVLALTATGNGVLEGAYAAFGVPVADVASAFKTFDANGRKVPKNVKEACKLTLMCEKQGRDYVLSDYDPAAPGPQTDIHPSNKGYQKIADTFLRVIKSNHLLGGGYGH